ncbi:MAG: hypothetical protein K2X27_23515 [Candidatus Obscuribacterales bacterium]|nr:hypothetical protein [Candidatus Obscuribacterales bacterium]
MSTDSLGTRDTSVLQLLARLLVETEKLTKFVDDLNKHGSTPQAKSALNVINSEVSQILVGMKDKIEPLYSLYEIDPGLKSVKDVSRSEAKSSSEGHKAEYDESSLWIDVKKQTP